MRYFVEFYPDYDENDNMIDVTHIWSEDEIYNKYIGLHPNLTKQEILEDWLIGSWGAEII